jgi:hypothetical protein
VHEDLNRAARDRHQALERQLAAQAEAEHAKVVAGGPAWKI